MAIGKIPGQMLNSNLQRNGEDLAIETDLLYVDVTNDRIGINTNTPASSLQVDNIKINGNLISASTGNVELGAPTDITITGGSADYVLKTDGSGNLAWTDVSSIAMTGTTITLGTPTDTALHPNGAINDWATGTKVTDALDDLNELSENILNSTAVANVDFTADVVSGGAGLVVTLTITADGTPTHYDINWGDGNSTTNTTDSTPTHTYASNTDSPFDVIVTAKNSSGTGKGATVSKTRSNYIVIYTADPVVDFNIYAASSGGSPITHADSGNAVYLENITTNSSSATVIFTVDWGDSSGTDTVNGNASAGGVGGARLAHTYTNASETDSSRTITVILTTHNTCTPAVLPVSDTLAYKVYATHTPTFTTTTLRGVNAEADSGHIVTFSNTTEDTVGSYTTFGNVYTWDWNGSTTNVNVGSGLAGDNDVDVAHTFALTSGQQSAGTTATFTVDLSLATSHTTTPFDSSTVAVIVEPDVRTNLASTAVTTSDKTGDNQYDLYDFTDLSGNNRALARFTNTSQNADSYVYDWGDSSADTNVTEDGSAVGSIGATIDHDYAGEGTGSYTASLTSSGTPDTIAQTDAESNVYTVNATPSAPSNLSTFTLTLSDSYQGTSPKLCAGFTDNSSSNPLSAGASLTTTTARRYTSGTIDTNVINNAYNGSSGTLSASVNGIIKGSKVFTTTTAENGTFTSLVVSGQDDAHNTISSSTYPSNFYQTFDAKITQALTSYTVGVNDQKLSHSATGNSSVVSVVYDDITVNPSVSAGTLAEGTSGTKKYISGVPYYNAGSPTVVLSGVEVSNFTGQTYQDTISPVNVSSGTNAESTSSNAISTTNFTYTQSDGATSMLTGGIPELDTGVASAYTLGALTVPITSSSVRTIDTLKVRAKNSNGTGSYVENSTKIAVHTASQSGINETAIPVSDDLGTGHDDDGIRVFDFNGDTTNTPSFTGATNFYTNSVYSEASDPGVAGTKEATVRLGEIEHNVVNYSTGYLPVGPNRSADSGTQYFTFAFRRNTVASFDISITTAGISGLWIAAPGTAIDDASGLNGWIDSSIQYAGSGVPGSDTGNGGNGSNGCASTGADVISTGSALNGSFTLTLGSENMSNATGSVVLVRIALASGESVTALSIGEAS